MNAAWRECVRVWGVGGWGGVGRCGLIRDLLAANKRIAEIDLQMNQVPPSAARARESAMRRRARPRKPGVNQV